MGAGMIYTHVAAALLALALGFAGGWNIQGWRLGEQISKIKTAQAEAVTAAITGARTQEQARFTTVQEAQNVATKRAQIARADAARARTELDRLRDATSATRGGVPGESATACAVRADTASDVLAQCAGEIAELAGTADRLNADRLMLMEAWPK